MRVGMLRLTGRHDGENIRAGNAISISFFDLEAFKNRVKTVFLNIQSPRLYILMQSNPNQT